MEKLTKSLRWIDDNLLKVFLVGYIFFIPLYPKIPLFNVNYTYIAIRVEDFYVVLLYLAFFIQLLRKKVTLSKKFIIPIALFWIAVMVSYFYGGFVQYTIENQNLKVGFLHAARRIEYMMIFFVAASVIRSKKDLYFYLKAMFIALALVCIYGFGQKVGGFPAIQTMNPEFAKGGFFKLSADARISSTFAGHYDLAAYLVILIPLVIGMFIITKKKIYFGLYVLALGALVLTASRISVGAYVLAIIPFLLIRKRFKLFAAVLVLTVAFTLMSDNLRTRIQRTIISETVFVDKTTGEQQIAEDLTVLPAGIVGSTKKGGKTISINAPSKEVEKKTVKLIQGKIRDDVVKKAQSKGVFLTEDQINQQVNDVFNNQIPIQKYFPDISQSTRYAIEWPRAIQAFLYNPILGKGPFSMTEAVDGDYFRWLGETGLAGTLTFLAIHIGMGLYIWKHRNDVPNEEKDMFYAYIACLIGLMINATYIDVFEASKVAFTYWLVAGLFIGTMQLHVKDVKKSVEVAKK
jgi:hypothetical protein